MQAFNERLASQMLGGLVANIDYPVFETRLEILQTKAQKMGYDFSFEVLEHIADNFTTTPRRLEGIIKKLGIHAKVYKELNIESVNRLLKREIDSEQRVLKSINIKSIVKAVSKITNISLADICSQKRGKQITCARQIAMFIAKTLSNVTLGGIGEFFGNRHHTTVLHAVNKVEDEFRKQNPNHIQNFVPQILHELKISKEKFFG